MSECGDVQRSSSLGSTLDMTLKVAWSFGMILVVL